MNWRTVERPGHFGKKREEFYKQYDESYGKGNWRIMWGWRDEVIPFDLACLAYEDAYYHDSLKRENLWKKLVSVAKEVYDYIPDDIKSGMDYSAQQGTATHLQDIAIRRVISRRGWRFTGSELVQIRSHAEYWGENLSPGKVQFHLPEVIVLPHLEKWWDYNSVEDFWQSNKILQIKENV
jgi:hypothetical protein